MKKFWRLLIIPAFMFLMSCNLLGTITPSEENVAPGNQVTPLVDDTPSAEQDQDSGTGDTATLEPNFIFEGVTLRYSSDIAANLQGVIAPEFQPEEAGIERATPELVEISFIDYSIPDRLTFIRIIPIERMLELDEYTAWHVNQLQELISTKPPTIPRGEYPFIPLWNAASLFESNLEYLDFHNGSGIRYLTLYSQAYMPVNNEGIFYTFQGMTSDGRFYIIAVLPIYHPELPASWDDVDEDWQGYTDPDFAAEYLQDTVKWLNSQSVDSFSPSLESLDEMIRSLTVER